MRTAIGVMPRDKHGESPFNVSLISPVFRREPTQVRSKFLTTSWMLRLFSAGVQAPLKGARVVYIDGETTICSDQARLNSVYMPLE